MIKLNVEERALAARKLFEIGMNCAQAVAMVYSDVVGVDVRTVENMMLAFGGGLGRQREVCGTVSAGSMVLGAVRAIEGGVDSKMHSYKDVQQFCNRFKEENGSYICRELLALGKGENANPEPTPRTESYYKRRPCADYVECSARLVGQMINENS